jgi:hypothetical protein
MRELLGKCQNANTMNHKYTIRRFPNPMAECDSSSTCHLRSGITSIVLDPWLCENALQIICQYQGIYTFFPNAKCVKEKTGQFFMDLWNEKEDDDVGVLTAIFPCLPSQLCGLLLCISSSKYCASYFQCWAFLNLFFPLSQVQVLFF